MAKASTLGLTLLLVLAAWVMSSFLLESKTHDPALIEIPVQQATHDHSTTSGDVTGDLVGDTSNDSQRVTALPPPKPEPEPEQVAGEQSHPPAQPGASIEVDYSSMPLAELSGLRATLTTQLNSLSAPIFAELISSGRYEVIGVPGDPQSFSSKDAEFMFQVQVDSVANEIRKVVIPEAEFPDVYAIKHQLEQVSKVYIRRGPGQ